MVALLAGFVGIKCSQNKQLNNRRRNNRGKVYSKCFSTFCLRVFIRSKLLCRVPFSSGAALLVLAVLLDAIFVRSKTSELLILCWVFALHLFNVIEQAIQFWEKPRYSVFCGDSQSNKNYEMADSAFWSCCMYKQANRLLQINSLQASMTFVGSCQLVFVLNTSSGNECDTYYSLRHLHIQLCKVLSKLMSYV